MAEISGVQGEVVTPADTVSGAERMGKLSLTMAWWAVCSAIFYIVVGASLALNYGARNAIIGMVLSVVCYGVINAVISRFAIRSGLSVAAFSGQLFGQAGSALATLIFFSTAIYYAVFEGSVIAFAINHLFPALDYRWAALLVVLYSVPLIFGSVQHWLDKFNGVLLPFYLLGLALTVAVSIQHYGYQPQWLSFGPASPPANGWWNCFTYYMGVWILMMYTFDYARFGRQEDSQYHARINFGMPFYLITFLLNGAVGIYLVSSFAQQNGVSETAVVVNILNLLGFWGLLFVWVTQTRINTANYYLATVNMQVFFDRLFRLRHRKIVWACVVGAAVYGLMLADVFAYILQALAYQGVFVVAWVGVALAHILGHRTLPATTAIRAFNPTGLIAWLLSVIAGVALMHGSALLQSFSAPVTFVVALALYRVLPDSHRVRG
ncbi:purine-cytosine permease family protein [Dickeya oryzae]|uniref:Allantoin permease n=1 Tax=Dickeya oryzae TaxID=1240404 RepID=A0AB39IRP0_9GAMM|nr:allantoin permease [Dickeya oryzae]MBP2850481.1 allantoin permease [Dickeya oryzae]MBP2858033.1 allantoin permease [Dickeya oryzae]MCA6991369.1 allantoin permease [Dickeya oryzae]MCA6993502.1 allantoin permease [Dickeya oryzae]